MPEMPDYIEDDWWEPPIDPPSPEVYIEDNPVIACLYHPDGHPLVVIHERPTVPVGYRKEQTP